MSEQIDALPEGADDELGDADSFDTLYANAERDYRSFAERRSL